MGNIIITNNDLGSIAIGEMVHNDEILTLAAAGTVKAGTLLARDATTLKMIPFVAGGALPASAILGYEVEDAAAGDVAIRAIVKGRVRAEKLVTLATNDNTLVTKAVLDQLRDFSIVSEVVTELNDYDNQPEPITDPVVPAV